MTVLAIETSTELCGVCLLSDDGVNVKKSIVEAHVHSEKLLTLVQGVVAEAKRELKNISAVAVSIGPGSFTGLRIGLSTAKGFCYALEKPLVTVPTFDAIAESVSRSGKQIKKIAVVVDAKQGEYYLGIFSRVNSERKSESSVEVLPAEQVRHRLQSLAPELIVTDQKERWRKELGAKVEYGDVANYCNAESVAQLGLTKARANNFADVASVEPMYLKDFVVKTAR